MKPLFLNHQVSLDYAKGLSEQEIIQELRELQFNEDYLSEKNFIRIPEETVEFCIAKKNDQIDLLLANLLKDSEYLGKIFKYCKKPIRLLILSNPYIRDVLVLPSEDTLSFFSKEKYKEFIYESPLDEIWNFFSNPGFKIDDFEFIFLKEGVYKNLSTDRYFEIIRAISANTNIISEDTPHSEYNIHEDGWSAYSRDRSNGAIWNILFHLKPLKSHAFIASKILKKCFFETTGIESPFIKELDDWNFDIKDTKGILEKSQESTERIIIKFFEIWSEENLVDLSKKKSEVEEIRNLRKIISTKIFQKVGYYLEDFFKNHPDKYVRYGYYANYEPTLESIDEYFKKDGDTFLEAACLNARFFRADHQDSKDIRNKLSDLTYENDKSGYGVNSDFKIKKRELEKINSIYIDDDDIEYGYYGDGDIDKLDSYVKKTSNNLGQEISYMHDIADSNERRSLKNKLDEISINFRSYQAITKNIEILKNNISSLIDQNKLNEIKNDKVLRNLNIFLIAIFFLLLLVYFSN